MATIYIVTIGTKKSQFYIMRTMFPEQQADFDFRLWQIELADVIKNAKGLVCRDSTPSDGAASNARCDGAGSLTIKIFWSGPGNSNQHRFTLQVS